MRQTIISLKVPPEVVDTPENEPLLCSSCGFPAERLYRPSSSLMEKEDNRTLCEVCYSTNVGGKPSVAEALRAFAFCTNMIMARLSSVEASVHDQLSALERKLR